jgi:hypothetical protein
MKKEKIELEILLGLRLDKKEEQHTHKLSTDFLETLINFLDIEQENQELPNEFKERLNNEIAYYDTHGKRIDE